MTGRMPLPVPWVQCCCCRCHCCCHVEHVGTHRGNSGTALTTEVSYVNNRGVEVFRVSGSFVDATLSSEKTKPRAGPQISSGLSDYKKRSQANSIRGRLFFALCGESAFPASRLVSRVHLHCRRRSCSHACRLSAGERKRRRQSQQGCRLLKPMV